MSKGVVAISSNEPKKAKTAGLIVIGDEILKGQVADENIPFLTKKLYGLGYKMKKVSVIGDTAEEIGAEIKRFSSDFDLVITSGGIGPTHDDLTYLGLANAFNEPVEINNEMKTLITSWLGGRGLKEEVILKMAEMPINANLIFDRPHHEPIANFPIVNLHNVYVFPGVPRFLVKLFSRLERILIEDHGAQGSFQSSEMHIAVDEMSITEFLNEAVVKFKDTVIFGSYPVFGNVYFKTRITLESHDMAEVEKAKKFLTSKIPPGSVVNYDAEAVSHAKDKVYAIVNDSKHSLHHVVCQAVKVIEESFTKYKNQELFVCFNGGKDCTALLHLVYAVAAKLDIFQEGARLRALCILTEDPFEEMENFIEDTAKRYKLDIWYYKGPIKRGLEEALQNHGESKGVFMGTRRSDPSGPSVCYFKMTDENWPQIMRISPILDWTYAQVWEFLRSLSLPYCVLYDRGFTSIGSRKNTKPNPKLEYTSEDGRKLFKPAYSLNDCSAERSGRQ